MARYVTSTKGDTISLRDRAASIRWAAERMANEYLAEDLRQFADQLDAEAARKENRPFNVFTDFVA